ncbi:MAG: hypothetical protein J0L64_17975 [Acidobacteria bacterium]|nr:hypothetical protein [Acidobacteriota bacterium]
MVKQETIEASAAVYCPACSHVVEARVVAQRRRGYRLTHATVPGQKCARCSGSLDAAVVLRAESAA